MCKKKKKEYLFWPIKYSFMYKKKENSICSDQLSIPSCAKKKYLFWQIKYSFMYKKKVSVLTD